MRTRFELSWGARPDDIDAGEDACRGVAGGDHARRADLISTDCGKPMLLRISNVVRHRICRRPFKRHAACVALGESTVTDVAEEHQWRIQAKYNHGTYLYIAMISLHPPLCLSGYGVLRGG